ncbi:UNVERIFIED_CONTAM: hypothetical protein FKN15_049468 [Acipenser sinensis]
MSAGSVVGGGLQPLSLTVPPSSLQDLTPLAPLSSLTTLQSSLGPGVGGEELSVLEAAVSSLAGESGAPSSALGRAAAAEGNPFQCLECGKTFKWSSRLSHHLRSHTSERPYRCSHCPKAFKGSSALLYHQRGHTGEKPYHCSDCGRSFKRASLLQPPRSPAAQLQKAKSQQHRHHQRGHERVKHEAQGGTPHSQEEQRTGAGQQDLTPLAPLSSLTTLQSSLGPGGGGEELSVLEAAVSSLAGESGAPSSALGRAAAAEGNPFQCLECGKTFKWSSRLSHHLRSHTSERPYRCSHCPKAFKGSSALLYHQRGHTGEKPYHCSDCGRSFKRASLLQVHRSVHTGVRAFQCALCGLSFKWSSHYQYHLRQHSGESPYACSSCPKSFKSSSSLRRHQSVHSGARPYTCPTCAKTFTQSTNLRQHQRTHTGEERPPRRAPRPRGHGNEQRDSAEDSNATLLYKLFHNESVGSDNAGLNYSAGNPEGNEDRGSAGNPEGSEDRGSAGNPEGSALLYRLTHSVGGHANDSSVSDENTLLNYSAGSNDTTLLYRLTHSHANDGSNAGNTDSPALLYRLPPSDAAAALSAPSQRFCCPLCLKLFISQPFLQKHLLYRLPPSDAAAALSAPSQRFCCPLCLKLFISQPFLQKHLQSHAIEQAYAQAGGPEPAGEGVFVETVVETLYRGGVCGDGGGDAVPLWGLWRDVPGGS